MSQEREERAGELPEKRPLRRNPWFWAILSGLITVPVIRPLFRHVPDPPPVIGSVPVFHLIDQRGQPFGSDDLRGKVWVASFFSTRCRTVCPPLMAAMRSLQDRYEKAQVDVRLVSITVDPETDSAAVLADYAAALGADPARWTFLTGDRGGIESLASKGFLTAIDAPLVGDGGVTEIGHGARLMLVDADLGLRGAYGSDDLGVDEVFHRSQHVLWTYR